jgi:polysaccharide pyruvyl transferase WcaK-like protein
MSGPRVLLIGYSGANNTGAEALLQVDIEDVRAVFGEEAVLTVPALKDPANLRRYLHEGPTLRIVRMPSIFLSATRRLVREHDIVLLVEGSAYMDSWTSALLWYFLWATRCADREGKPCLAYAVDAGQLRPRNQRLVRRWANTTELIVTRSRAAADRLRRWGVTAPLESTADNAFNFEPRQEDRDWANAIWPELDRPPVGIAAVDFSRWPVVIRPWGRAEDRYRWPYYFSTSSARRRASGELARGYARLADRMIERHERSVALICMEELDEPFARAIHREMAHPERAGVFSSREHDASRMTALLRSLGVLVTSRYHASVLSLPEGVPQVAVGHDLRLRTLYEELGLDDAFFAVDDPGMFDGITNAVERLLRDPATVRDRLLVGYEAHAAAARRNKELLQAFAVAHGWGVPAWAT